MKNIINRSLVTVILVALSSALLSSCTKDQKISDINPYDKYFRSMDISEKKSIWWLDLKISKPDSVGGTFLYEKNCSSSGKTGKNGNITIMYNRLLLISGKGFEVYFVLEKKLAGQTASQIQTTCVFFPYGKKTTQKIFDEYTVEGQFVPARERKVRFGVFIDE